jgi:riboflavin biosynthesis pyrimidine reductase
VTGERPAGPVTQARPAGPVRLERLWDAGRPGSARAARSSRGGTFPASLHDAYDGELRIPLHPDRPTVVANFVSTLDGVVAFDVDGGSGGGEVSGFFDPDRFLMGLLRAMADVVLVGAGTVRAAPTHEWTARRVHPASAALYAKWRARIGISKPQPTTMVVTAGGSLDPRHPGLSASDIPVIIATTRAGARRARATSTPLGSNVSIEVAGSGDRVMAPKLLDIAGSIGARLVLCEGGPHLIGDLMGAGLVDELFLTIAPQVAGRDVGTPRLGFVAGRAFAIAEAPWANLVSVRRAADHLFLRYRLDPTAS